MADDNWHLDKKVPIALIFTMLVQFAAGIWFASQLSGRVDQNTRDILRLEAMQSETGRDSADMRNRIIRIEEKLLNQTDILRRIEEAVSPKRP